MITVYSASAGSGKTYTLARQVIDLLIKDPNSYCHILAVTFTNKATAEMKSRIVRDLSLITTEKPKTEKESRDRARIIEAQQRLRKEKTGEEIDEETIVGNCKRALDMILSDYSHLSVSTIDSFVQGVIRAFAYEMDLPATYAIQIDEETVMQSAVDDIMEGMAQDPTLREWMVSYANDLLSDGKSTKGLEGEIRRLGKNVISDKWAELSAKVPTEIGRVSEMQKKVAERRYALAGEIVKEFAELHTSLKGKTKYASDKLMENAEMAEALTSSDERKKRAMAMKILEATVFKEENRDKNVDYYFKKGAGTEGDKETFRQLKESIMKKRRQLLTCDVVMRNIDALGLLTELRQRIEEAQRETNTIVISSLADLLKKLIGECEIPFIYEKYGTRFDTIMIDEFQDTSRLQYDNFKPLIANSLSNGHDCLIVGDVKQSIYRFRNGDWRLLNDLHGKRDSVLGEHVEPQTLDTNWRSRREIVELNNAIYNPKTGMPDILSEALGDKDGTIGQIYGTWSQKVRDDAKRGYVRIKLHEEDENRKEEQDREIEKEYRDIVKDLHDNRGFRYRDICFLVNKKDDAMPIIQCMSDNGIPVMSDDALTILGMPTTWAIISMMRYMVSSDPVSLFTAASTVSGKTPTEMVTSWPETAADLDRRLTELQGIGIMEVYGELTNMIPREAYRREHPFIEALSDKLREFVQNGNASLSDFVELAERNEHKWTIEAPDGQDAVMVMTIHKSKGLEFEAVLIPRFEWQLAKGDTEVWCETERTVVGDIGDVVMPVSYGKSMQESEFGDYYQEEKRLEVIDALNKAYVATTRASSALYIWGECPAKDEMTVNKNARISQLLRKVLGGELTYEQGDVPNLLEERGGASKSEEETEQQDIFADTDMAMESHRPTAGTTLKDTGDEKDEKIHNGLVLHSLLENIVTDKDISRAMSICVMRRNIDEENAKEIEAELRLRLKDVERYGWFGEGMKKVWREQRIFDGEQTLRPDRVMERADGSIVVLDYKFGMSTSAETLEMHTNQVRGYMTLLKKLWPEKEIDGYIWYYNKKFVRKVEL